MATYRHGTPGTMLSSKKIVISDAITSSGNTDFSLIQPKDTIVDEVFIRVLEATELHGRIACTTAATTGGKLEIHVVFRYFD